jgi:KipI family sensor histidine kinase inhibitor
MIASRPAGDAGLLIDTDLPPARLAAAITRAGLPGVTDVVPGARTVLVILKPGAASPGEVATLIADLPVPAAGSMVAEPAEIDVVYDGPDLADVAELTGLSVTEVIRRHSESRYTVGWLGFSPGFGYLTGLDPRLSTVPRLETPRVAVPAGSVAIAAGLAAVYPSSSPGGWRILGHTRARLWDVDRDPPALLTPGQVVTFRPVTTDKSDVSPAGPGAQLGLAEPTRLIEVVRPGLLATVQDLGRPGLGSLGVPPSGAADPVSLIGANRLTGNADDAAGLELTLGRAEFRFSGDVTVAVTGALAPVTIVARDGVARPADSPVFEVADGGLVRIGPASRGLRGYLAVAGGIAVPAVLGSRSSDLLSRLGRSPLRAGDVLPVGSSLPASRPDLPPTPLPGREEVAELRVIAGPRLDWFEPAARQQLSAAVYTVTAASNRTGLRLDGPPLRHATSAELPSEGVVTGSVQVPRDGRPILLLAEHPVTGGYPVIAVVVSADLGLAAQLRPGNQLRFTVT